MQYLFNKVAEFNKAFDIHENKVFSALPSPAESQLSYNMLLEEVHEYGLAMREYNAIEVADGLTDILYLVIGAFRRHGISADTATKLFNEVHASNMSKVPADGKLLKRADGKVMKPETYRRPNLALILEDN